MTPAGPDGPAADPGAITAWLVARVAEHVDLAESIDVHEPLTSYGLASRDAILLSGELEEWLGRPVSPTLAYEYPSIDALARHLAGAEGDRTTRDEQRPPAGEPIAVVGIGCRFPGASGPDAFWRLLRDGVDAIREVPPDRWDIDALYASEPGTRGRMSTRWGGFLDDIDQFDAGFFAISPREAASLDPQQRLLLEVTWEALEDAGEVPGILAGTQTGTFVGISAMDYSHLIARLSDPLAAADIYTSTGNAHSLAANRLAYALDLRGPSIAVDTACSSSLVALHLACHSLRAGESRVALAGGVNVILEPSVTVSFSQANMMAADGRCKTFDADGDGYARGEGVGMLVLKRVSDAVRDGNYIYGIVRGTAVNQDGRTAGITAPSGLAQRSVIRAALAQAGTDARRLSYVEAHGTGTALGDPIEVNALGAALGPAVHGEQPCWLGSVKTNIGHLEAAAGIAGVIKVLLSLVHETIPRHLHLRRLNPLIHLDGTRLAIPTGAQPWPRSEEPRIAGVSSFGFGGTNAHAVIEEAPVRPPRPQRPDGAIDLLTLSATTGPALRRLAEHLAGAITGEPDLDIADVCHSANVGRARFPHRAAIVAAGAEELVAGLAALVAGAPAAGICQGYARGRHRPKTAFLFAGQGSQYAGMGADLYRTEPVFRAAIDDCHEIIQSVHGQRLLPALLRAGATGTDDITTTPPALFAVEYALVELWRSWGVTPDLLLGHGLGEYVAATTAGVFGVGDGLGLVCERARLMGRPPSDETMAAARAIRYAPPRIPIVSSVTGQVFADGDVPDAAYWIRQAFSPVNRTGEDAWRTLAGNGCEICLEVSPQPALLNLVRASVHGDDALLVASLRPGRPESRCMAEAAAALFTRGVEVQRPVPAGRQVPLPTAPFDRGRHWLPTEFPTVSRDGRDSSRASSTEAPPRPVHPLLGVEAPIAPAAGVRVWEQELDGHSLAYLADHRIDGAAILPVAAYLGMAIAAGGQAFGGQRCTVSDVVLERPLIVADRVRRRVQTTVAARGDRELDFQVSSREIDSPGDTAGVRVAWALHARGRIRRA